MATALDEADLDDPVTRHMHQDYTCLRADHTVGEALEWLRRNPPVGGLCAARPMTPGEWDLPGRR